MEYQLLSDEMLVKLLRVEDGDALREIYRRYWKIAFNACYFRTGSEDVAKDLVQNLFLNLWEKRDTNSIQHLESYIVKSVKNRVINYVAAQVVRQNHLRVAADKNNAQECGADNAALYGELASSIDKAINLLPDKTREVFRLSRLEHQSNNQIATRLNLTEKAVEYHITKSIKILRVHLRELITS